MSDPVIGYRQGQRVRALKSAGSPSFDGVIHTVVVPTKGQRFVVVVDDQGRAHHRWFHEIEVIWPAQEMAREIPAPRTRKEFRELFEGSWDDLHEQRGVKT